MSSRAIATAAPSPSPLRVLVVYAHPDDESFGPAALLAKYAREGAKIAGLFFTRGQFGRSTVRPEPSPAELGWLRERDLRAAAAAIGFTRVDVLDYVDGTLGRMPPAQLAADVFTAIRRHRPDVVLTFGPGGITHHPDHVAVYQAATLAFGQGLRAGLGLRELYYVAIPPSRAHEMNLVGELDAEPNTYVDVAATEPIRVEALRIHGRHILDAREAAIRFAREPQVVATLFRVWPPVSPGVRLTGFLHGADARQSH